MLTIGDGGLLDSGSLSEYPGGMDHMNETSELTAELGFESVLGDAADEDDAAWLG